MGVNHLWDHIVVLKTDANEYAVNKCVFLVWLEFLFKTINNS